MSDFNRALFRIDPTEGLLQYVQKVKPFHTKALEVLVEYVYIEPMVVTATERFHLTVGLPGFDSFDSDEPATEITYASGYGISWSELDTFAHGGVNQATVIAAVGVVQTPITVMGSDVTYTPMISGYDFPVGTQVVFEAEPVSNLPSNVNPAGPQDYDAGLLPSGASSGERFHIIASDTTTHTLTLSKSRNGTPVAFAAPGSGSVTLTPVALPPTSPEDPGAPFPHNTLVIEPPVYPSYSISVEDGTRGLFRFVESFDIEAVDAANRSIDVDGDVTTPVTVKIGGEDGVATRLHPGSTVTIAGNFDATSNRQYTVSSVASLGGNKSRITFVEPIPSAANGSGQVLTPVQDDYAPQWTAGTAVSLSSPSLPSQVQGVRTFYQPTSPIGTFKLSRTRFPAAPEQFITLPNLTPPSFTIKRTEPFVPGERFYLSNSHDGSINGGYTVESVSQEGASYRVHVREHISQSTPTGLPSDGIIKSGGTYGSPSGVPMSSSSLVIAANMHERISFDFGPIPVAPYVFDTFAGIGNLLNREGDSGHTWATFNDNSDDLTELFMTGDGYVRSADTNIWARTSWAAPDGPCFVEVEAKINAGESATPPYIRIFIKESDVVTFYGPHVDIYAEDGKIALSVHAGTTGATPTAVLTSVLIDTPVVVRLARGTASSLQVSVDGVEVFSSTGHTWPSLTTTGFNLSNPTGDPSALGVATFHAEAL